MRPIAALMACALLPSPPAHSPVAPDHREPAVASLVTPRLRIREEGGLFSITPATVGRMPITPPVALGAAIRIDPALLKGLQSMEASGAR